VGAVVGIAAGAVVVIAAIASYLLFRAKSAKGSAKLPSSEHGGDSSDSAEMTTTIAPVTIVDAQDLLGTRCSASAPEAIESVFDQLSDEIC
jgi:hypothetical protein